MRTLTAALVLLAACSDSPTMNPPAFDMSGGDPVFSPVVVDPDYSVTSDASAAPDLAAALDLSQPDEARPDLTTAPDLVAVADLTPAVDLMPSAPDLTTSPDMQPAICAKCVGRYCGGECALADVDCPMLWCSQSANTACPISEKCSTDTDCDQGIAACSSMRAAGWLTCGRDHLCCVVEGRTCIKDSECCSHSDGTPGGCRSTPNAGDRCCAARDEACDPVTPCCGGLTCNKFARCV